MIDSPAWQDLKNASIKLYILLKLHYTGENENEITLPYTIAEKSGISKAIIKNAFDDLIRHGFIDRVVEGRFARIPNVYKLSDKWASWKKVYNATPKTRGSIAPKTRGSIMPKTSILGNYYP